MLAAAEAVSVDGARAGSSSPPLSPSLLAVEEIENDDDDSSLSWSAEIVRVVKVPEARELAAACAAAAASAATRAAFSAVGDFAAALAAAPLSLFSSSSRSFEEEMNANRSNDGDDTPLRQRRNASASASPSSRYNSSSSPPHSSSWTSADFLSSWKRQAKEAAVFAATDRRAQRVWLGASLVALAAAVFAALALRFAARVACALSPSACVPFLAGNNGVVGGGIGTKNPNLENSLDL